MSDFLIGPNPCHHCGGEYGSHESTCRNNPRNQPPPLSKQIEALANNPRSHERRLQMLIELTARLAKDLESLQ